MLIAMTPDRRLQYSTVRMEVAYASGASGVGTAFHFGFTTDDGRVVPMVVTNRHVIWDPTEGPAIEGSFQVHESRVVEGQVVPADAFRTVHFTSQTKAFHEYWRGHSDSCVDLCAMMAMPLKRVMNQMGCAPFINVISDSLALRPEQVRDLNVVEDVLMVGYPTGLSDELHNLPLFRKGATATHPAVDFQGRPEFLVDLACFPGSSGSPVFAVRRDSYPLEEAGGRHDPRRFLGVLYAGPTLGGSMVNLGMVVRADKVRELAGQVWQHWSDLGYIMQPWSSGFAEQPGGLSVTEDGTLVE